MIPNDVADNVTDEEIKYFLTMGYDFLDDEKLLAPLQQDS
jgi:hypothetical protein